MTRAATRDLKRMYPTKGKEGLPIKLAKQIVCRKCGEVSEFEEPGIETLQDEVARRHGFLPTTHRLDIYGYCSRCAHAAGADEPR